MEKTKAKQKVDPLAVALAKAGGSLVDAVNAMTAFTKAMTDVVKLGGVDASTKADAASILKSQKEIMARFKKVAAACSKMSKANAKAKPKAKAK